MQSRESDLYKDPPYGQCNWQSVVHFPVGTGVFILGLLAAAAAPAWCQTTAFVTSGVSR